MPIFDFILKELSSHIKKRFIIFDFCSAPQGVFFAEKGMEYTPDNIYIGSWNDIRPIVEEETAPKHTTFFISAESSLQFSEIRITSAYNVIFTDLSVSALNNRLTAAIIKLHNMHSNDINPAFNRFLYEIIFKQKNNIEDIKEISRTLDNKILQYFNFVIIKSEDSKLFLRDTSSLFSELSAVFPDCNVSVFENKIIVLYTRSSRYVKLPRSIEKALEEFLNKYNAIASVGTPFRDYHMLKTEYYICSNLLKIVSHLDDKNKSRIFNEDDFGPYFIIDLCARKYEELFSSNDIIYLVHPGLIALSRYDLKHNTNLRDLLYCYLSNDRNLSRTAKEMFMHRNTVLNKLSKIREIIDDDLDNYAVRFRLTFSFMIIKYYEQFKNLKLHL